MVAQPPEETAGAGDGDDGALGVVGGQGLGLVQRRLLVLVPSELEQHPGEEVDRVERRRCFMGGAGESLRGREGRERVRLPGRRPQQLGVGPVAGVEAQQRQPHRVAVAVRALALELVGEDVEQPAPPQLGQLGPDDVAVHRMTEPDLLALPVDDERCESTLLERLDRGAAGEPFEHGEPERFAEGDQFERLPDVGREVAEPVGDELGQPRRACRRVADDPHAVLLGEEPEPVGLVEQLPEEQSVAPAAGRQSQRRRSFDLPAEHPLEQRHDRVEAERFEVDPLEQAVLPQRRHRRWHLGVGSHRRHHRDLVAGDELVDERGGRVVEPVRVVEGEEHRAAFAGLLDGASDADEAGRTVGKVAAGGQQRREAAERDGL